MSKIGYGRVSSVGQSLDVQLGKLHNVGCDTIFQETHTIFSSESSFASVVKIQLTVI